MMWKDPLHLLARKVLRAFRMRRGRWKLIPYPPTVFHPGQTDFSDPFCLPQLPHSIYNPRIDFI